MTVHKTAKSKFISKTRCKYQGFKNGLGLSLTPNHFGSILGQANLVSNPKMNIFRWVSMKMIWFFNYFRVRTCINISKDQEEGTYITYDRSWFVTIMWHDHFFVTIHCNSYYCFSPKFVEFGWKLSNFGPLKSL